MAAGELGDWSRGGEEQGRAGRGAIQTERSIRGVAEERGAEGEKCGAADDGEEWEEEIMHNEIALFDACKGGQQPAS